MMNGKIWVESVLNKGSTFSFTIYAKKSDVHADIEENIRVSDIEMQENEFTGCKILLAEDIEINCIVLMALLDNSGIEFDIAENGKIACEKYAANPELYDMIFMDIQMPEMDGFAATEIIRSSEYSNAKTVPIIAMTANAFREDIDQCLAAGMDGHIAKPIELDKVTEIIRKFYSSQ